MLLTAGCQGGSSPEKPPPPPAVTVQTTHPDRGDVDRVITLPGDLLPIREATLYAKAPGYLDKILVDKGDIVQAGQLLAEIRAPELDADAVQAARGYDVAVEASRIDRDKTRRTEAETRKARSEADKAKTDIEAVQPELDRAKALSQQAQSAMERAAGQRALAIALVEEAKSNSDRSQADVDAARAEKQVTNLTLSRLTGIWNRDKRLIARQQVDEAEARSGAADAKLAAAVGALATARQKVRSAELQVGIADQAINEAKAGLQAAKQQESLVAANGRSLERQLQTANREVEVRKQDQQIASGVARQSQLESQAKRAAVDRTQSVAGFARIIAPFPGQITKRFVDTGAFIQTAAASQSAAAIVTVANVDTLRLDLYVPESESRFIKAGTEIEASGPALGKETLKAKVTRTAGALDPRTRTLLTEVEAPNKDHKLLPGAYLNVRISLERHKGVLRLPSLGVASDKSGKFVMAVVGSKPKRIPVKVGFDDGRHVEIMSGLQGDEEVIVTGRDNVTTGPVKTEAWVAVRKP